MRDRREEGRVGLYQQAVERAVCDDLAQLDRVGEGDDAAERQEAADPQTSLASCSPPVKQWKIVLWALLRARGSRACRPTPLVCG